MDVMELGSRDHLAARGQIMSEDLTEDQGKNDLVEKVYEDFLRRQTKDTSYTFEDLCRDHPEIAPALHAWHSVQMDARTASAPKFSDSGRSAKASGRGGILREGDYAGSYRIVRLLGQGGFGEVYLANQKDPTREVALKVIRAGLDTKEVLARFEAERQALALMNNPHIATVYDAGRSLDGRPFFVMEYTPGSPITQYCDEEQLDIRTRLQLFLKACEAIQHAHQKGVIHRDVKPSNVLVTQIDRLPTPKVIDFGLAKALHQKLTEQTLNTQIGQIVGTPAYMAPEQAKSSERIDRRVDIFSLGVLLYELLTGKLPFEPTGDYVEFFRRLLHEDPITPSHRVSRLESADELAAARKSTSRALPRELRGDLDWITLKAMEKDPGRRYSSVADLASDVAGHLNDEPILAGPPSAIRRLRKLVRKHRSAVAVGSIVVLFISILTYGYIRRVREATRLYSMAISAHDDYISLSRDIKAQYATWKEERNRTPMWARSWDRGRETDAWNRLVQLVPEIEPRFSAASFRLNQAAEGPLGNARREEILTKLEAAYLNHYEEDRGGTLPLSEIRRELIMLLPSVRPEGSEFRGRVRLRTTPPGAEVYCFRFEERESRLLPLPFDPQTGLTNPAEEMSLIVDKVRPEHAPPFQTGDRFLEVDNRAVRTRTELASALATISVDQAVVVRFERSATIRSTSWTPYPRARLEELRAKVKRAWGNDYDLPAGSVVNSYIQFGFTFSGYPLDVGRHAPLGTTTDKDSLTVDLPAGSYLLVITKEGYEEIRYPVVIPRKESAEEIELVKSEDCPPGFVRIPSMHATTGGERSPDAFQSQSWGQHRIDGFFISRLEVTRGEWSQFVNAPTIFELTGEDGFMSPRSEELKGKVARVRIIPSYKGDLLMTRESTSWLWRVVRPDWPVIGISQHAALEYVHWLNSKTPDGRWRYRLPTGFEWELAARGVDRRSYVWGNYMIWGNCLSHFGNPVKGFQAVGSYPLDESVFGVRDMNGSASEHTVDRPDARRSSIAHRGGAWDQVDNVYFLLVSRNTLLPSSPNVSIGCRLAADLRHAVTKER